MRSDGCGARIAKTAENPKSVVGWRNAVEKLVRSVVPANTTWTDVKEESGGGKSVRPKPRGDVGVKQQRADTVVKSANDALSTAILLGRVGASETEDGAVRRKEVADRGIVKFFAIISL